MATRTTNIHIVAVAMTAVAALITSACGGSSSKVPYDMPDGGVWLADGVSDGNAVTPTDAGTGTTSDGQALDAAAPVDAPVDSGLTGAACTKHSVCLKDHPETPFCAVNLKICVQCLIDTQCKEPGTTCQNHTCQKVSCVPGNTKCQDTFLATCKGTGDGWDVTICPDGKPVCVKGSCRLCMPGELFCAPPPVVGQPSKLLRKCGPEGHSAADIEPCKGDQVCLNGACGTCQPGQKRCSGQVAEACAPDGSSWQLAQDCSAKSLTCLGGLCVNPCSGDFKSNTNVGCDYWAVDLDNALEISGGKKYDAQNAQFSVIVSNTSTAPAKVHVTLGPDKNAPNAKTTSFTVPAGGLQVIDLPHKSWGIKNQNQDGTGINKMVYRVQSEQPIVAYQFNPLQNYGVFSNDASLLLPSNALGKEYWVMSRTQLENKYRSYFAVVAAKPGTTKVTVVSSGKTLAGSGVPGMSVGNKKVFTLKQGQVLNVESDKANGDLSGTWIQADQPVAVFGGHEAANSPSVGNCVVSAPNAKNKVCAYSGMNPMLTKACTSDKNCESECCADHLEEQLFPVEAWGKQYVGARLYPRGKEKDAWRVLAAENGTQVTLKPAIGVTLPNGGKLEQGQYLEFETTKDFVIEANKPILVTQYMASSFATVTTVPIKTTCNSDAQCKQNYGYEARCESGGFLQPKWCRPIGDPSMILDVATSQYLDDYVFLVPNKYKQNYITVIASQGTSAQLDKKNLTGGNFMQIAGTKWMVGRQAISPGVHRLTATKPVGLFVYGYDSDVSYGYPGGAGLAQDDSKP